MDDPRHAFIESLILDESYVLAFDGYIFLCGGKVDASADPPVSIREALLREFIRRDAFKARVRLADGIDRWSFDGHYTDLLEFESHIAELSAAIILVLESPGALAELGIFASFDQFRDKLILVMSNHHYEEKSFIRLGPVKFLEDNLGNQAECFPWMSRDIGLPRYDGAAVAEMQGEIFESVSRRVSDLTRDSKFDPAIWLHVALLVCEVIGLFGALTIGEIKEFLERLGVRKTQAQVKKVLFMLELMEMLRVVARSSQRFYVSLIDRELVRWKVEQGVFDRGKIAYGVANFYEKTDKRRFRVIQEVRGAR